MPKMHGPYDQVGWGGASYRKDSSGTLEVPAEAVADLLALGMKLGAPPSTSTPATVAPVVRVAPKPEPLPVEVTPSDHKSTRAKPKRG